MTDKATVTIPSGLVGRVVRTHGNVGQTVAVGAQLVSFATLDVEEKQYSIEAGAACLPLSMSAGSMPPLVQQAVSPTVSSRNGAHPQASPAVRRRARELHVDLQHVHGTGPNGRVTHGDIDVHLRSEVSPSPSSHRRPYGSHTTEIQMVGMRRRIAEKMVVSNSQIPHFTYIEEIDITELESLREHLNASRTDGQPKLTYLPFIMI